MCEKVVVFGGQAKLVGIVTVPRPELRNPCLPAIVILNAGLIPHVGPHRLSVRLARRMAALGGTALRFDLGGLGDSERSHKYLPYLDGVFRDITAAFDHLEKAEGTRLFVLAGICSGAENALGMAVRDQRIVGAILIDGLSFTFQTTNFYLRHYGIRALSLRRWLGLTRRGLNSLRIKKEDVNLSVAEGNSFDGLARPKPLSRAIVAAQFQSLVDRAVGLDIIYTGGASDYYNYKGQFVDAFREVDFRGCLTVEHLPKINHTFTELHAQDWLLESIADWMHRRYLL